jgi:hypothetical protein
MRALGQSLYEIKIFGIQKFACDNPASTAVENIGKRQVVQNVLFIDSTGGIKQKFLYGPANAFSISTRRALRQEIVESKNLLSIDHQNFSALNFLNN